MSVELETRIGAAATETRRSASVLDAKLRALKQEFMQGMNARLEKVMDIAQFHIDKLSDELNEHV